MLPDAIPLYCDASLDALIRNAGERELETVRQELAEYEKKAADGSDGPRFRV